MYLTASNGEHEGGRQLHGDFYRKELNAARCFTYQIVHAYWQRICRKLTAEPLEMPPLPEELRNSLWREREFQDPTANLFASHLPDEYNLNAAYKLTNKYASLLGPELRSKYGIY